MSQTLFPTKATVTREQRETLLNQRACVIWFTGLSGSGKTTLAKALQAALFKHNRIAHLLDGDNIRTGLNSDLGFSQNDRTENIRRIAEVSKLFVDAGLITLNCFVTPTEDLRRQARDIIGENDMVEIHVKCSVEECEKRDVKGLYQRARRGEVKDFTGISAPFEEPTNPSLIVDTEHDTLESCVQLLTTFVLDRTAR
ncbi:MAG TPA: adenylyl-sulfate kinase [Chitinophagales bacterium]|nr:adenylyl-sulfate kinase [Chitinophagales bacterium]